MSSCRKDYLGLIPRCFGKAGGVVASPFAAVVSVVLALVLVGIGAPGIWKAEIETNIEKLCKFNVSSSSPSLTPPPHFLPQMLCDSSKCKKVAQDLYQAGDIPSTEVG